jgi:hypothetical protein
VGWHAQQTQSTMPKSPSEPRKRAYIACRNCRHLKLKARNLALHSNRFLISAFASARQMNTIPPHARGASGKDSTANTSPSQKNSPFLRRIPPAAMGRARSLEGRVHRVPCSQIATTPRVVEWAHKLCHRRLLPWAGPTIQSHRHHRFRTIRTRRAVRPITTDQRMRTSMVLELFNHPIRRSILDKEIIPIPGRRFTTPLLIHGPRRYSQMNDYPSLN